MKNPWKTRTKERKAIELTIGVVLDSDETQEMACPFRVKEDRRDFTKCVILEQSAREGEYNRRNEKDYECPTDSKAFVLNLDEQHTAPESCPLRAGKIKVVGI